MLGFRFFKGEFVGGWVAEVGRMCLRVLILLILPISFVWLKSDNPFFHPT